MKFDDLYNKIAEKTVIDAVFGDEWQRDDPKGPFTQKYYKKDVMPFTQKVEPAGPQGFKGPSKKVKDAARDASIKPRFSVKTPSRKQMKASKDRFLQHKKTGFQDPPSLKDRLDKLTLPEKTIKENIKAASKGLKTLGTWLKRSDVEPKKITDAGTGLTDTGELSRTLRKGPEYTKKLTTSASEMIRGNRGKVPRQNIVNQQTSGLQTQHKADRAKRISDLLKEYKKYK